jgi:crossover junction endodeoxyribonuclease RusA
MLTVALPYPPTVNHYYVRSRFGVVLGARGREYREVVRAALQEKGVPAFSREALSFTLAVFPPDKRVRDLDNVIKAVQDAATHAGLWPDDFSICELHVIRGTAYRRIGKRRHEGVPGGLVVLGVAKTDPSLIASDADAMLRSATTGDWLL